MNPIQQRIFQICLDYQAGNPWVMLTTIIKLCNGKHVLVQYGNDEDRFDKKPPVIKIIQFLKIRHRKFRFSRFTPLKMRISLKS
jgi:hypothetical protein